MLSYLNDAMDQYLYVIMIIILIALLFGIVNTMMMAVLERIKELGMLMAIGMSRMRVFWMIVLETVLLSLTGAVLGIVLGMLTIRYFGRVGIDLSHLGQRTWKCWVTIRLFTLQLITFLSPSWWYWSWLQAFCRLNLPGT